MSQPQQFSTPGSPSGGLDMTSLEGSLVLVQVLGLEEGIPTVHGDRSAIRATVSVLDGPHEGGVHEDSLIWGKVMQSQLRGKIGELVLGRVGKGEKKPGQNAPWILNAPTPNDVETANAWMRRKAQPAVTSAEAPF